MKPIVFVIASTSLMLAGCSPLQRQAEILASEQGCCRRLSAFKSQELKVAQPMEIVISESSSSFPFSEGKSFAAVFDLPHDIPIARATLKTFLTGFLVRDSQVFCPAVTFLDGAFMPILATGPLPISLQRERSLTSYGFWYVNFDVPEGTRHLVIHTAAASIGKQLPFAGPGNLTVPCGQVGKLALELR